MPDNKNHFETDAIRIQTRTTEEREHSTPLYMTSSFTFESAEHARAVFTKEIEGNVYSRYSNPNTDEFIAKMCSLEGADMVVATSSEMAGVFGCLAGWRSGRRSRAGIALDIWVVPPDIESDFAAMGNQFYLC